MSFGFAWESICFGVDSGGKWGGAEKTVGISRVLGEKEMGKVLVKEKDEKETELIGSERKKDRINRGNPIKEILSWKRRNCILSSWTMRYRNKDWATTAITYFG